MAVLTCLHRYRFLCTGLLNHSLRNVFLKKKKKLWGFPSESLYSIKTSNTVGYKEKKKTVGILKTDLGFMSTVLIWIRGVHLHLSIQRKPSNSNTVRTKWAFLPNTLTSEQGHSWVPSPALFPWWRTITLQHWPEASLVVVQTSYCETILFFSPRTVLPSQWVYTATGWKRYWSKVTAKEAIEVYRKILDWEIVQTANLYRWKKTEKHQINRSKSKSSLFWNNQREWIAVYRDF